MRKCLMAAVAAASTGLFAMGASAAEYTGFYVGAGVGKTHIKVTDEDLGFDGSDTSFRILGGYQFNKNLAVEAAYFNGGSPEDTLFDVNLAFDTSGLTAAVLGIVPVGDVFGLYGKLGAASYDAKATASFRGSSSSDSGSETDLLYGAGAMFDIGERFQIRAEYEVIDIDGGDFNMLSLNGVYKFGS